MCDAWSHARMKIFVLTKLCHMSSFCYVMFIVNRCHCNKRTDSVCSWNVWRCWLLLIQGCEFNVWACYSDCLILQETGLIFNCGKQAFIWLSFLVCLDHSVTLNKRSRNSSRKLQTGTCGHDYCVAEFSLLQFPTHLWYTVCYTQPCFVWAGETCCF